MPGVQRRVGGHQGGRVIATAATGRRTAGRFGLGLALIALAGLALRVTYVVGVRHDRVKGDGFFYHFVGNFLAEGKGFINPLTYFASGTETPTAIHPPA